MIKRVEYFGEMDSTGKMKFEGDISRTRFTWCGKADSIEEVWFRKGYKEVNPQATFVWNQFETARQLKHRTRSKRGEALQSTWWYNNGQVKYTTTQDTLVDSVKTVTYWHKNGNKQKSKTFIHPLGGIVDRKTWNINGILVTHQNVPEEKSIIWSDEGDLRHVFHNMRRSSGSVTEATHYKKGEVISKAKLKDGVIISEELFTKRFKDSSVLYLDSAWTLQKGIEHGVDDPYAHVPQLEFYYDKAIFHDITNINAYWKKMWLYGNDFKARRKIIEPLWKIDSALFDCDQTLFYAYFLLRDREYAKAENVLTLALERWDDGLMQLFEVYEQRARTYAHLGEIEKACSDINRVIEYKYLQDNSDLEALKAEYKSIIQQCD
ncbi:MAG: hypothetical protein JKX73_09480 [Flavobacteriales bacterium]|nr:hypothetical protein [Flavobacteriales bacterium]